MIHITWGHCIKTVEEEASQVGTLGMDAWGRAQSCWSQTFLGPMCHLMPLFMHIRSIIKSFFFTAYSPLALFFKIWDCIYIKTIYCYGIQSIQNDSQLLLPTKWRINASSIYSNSVFNPFPFNLENQFGCVYSWKPSPLLKGPPAWICCRVVNQLSTEIY